MAVEPAAGSREDTPASRDLVKAVAWVTLGAFLFALMFMLPKLASAAVPPLQVAFLRYLAGFVTIAPFFLLD